MQTISKRRAVEYLDQCVTMLYGLGDEPARLAAEISEAIKFSLLPPQERYSVRHQYTPKSQQRTDRNARICEQYSAGLPVSELANEFGISGARVRQIATRAGAKRPEDFHTRTRDRERARREAVDARSIAKYGVDSAGAKVLRTKGLIEAYRQQRNACRSRQIAWDITFPAWLAIWEASGHVDQRGLGKGRYLMVRRDPAGPYVDANVVIVRHEEFASFTIKRTLREKRVAPRTGVYCLYPGLAKPWVAKVRNKSIGSFATPHEATLAREAALAI